METQAYPLEPSTDAPQADRSGFRGEVGDVGPLLECRKQAPIGGGGVRLTVVHVEAHGDGVQDVGHAADVIRMWVSGDQEVDLVDVQVVEQLAWVASAGVDEGSLTFWRADNYSVGLSHIEESDLDERVVLGGVPRGLLCWGGGAEEEEASEYQNRASCDEGDG